MNSPLLAGRTPVTLRVPFAASSVAVARESLRRWLAEAGSSNDVIENARLVVSELVGNSVRHARPLPGGDLLVTWQACDQGVQITVTDGGSGTRPRTVKAGSSALAGRGLAIVDTLTQKWWAERSSSRSTVHAVLGC